MSGATPPIISSWATLIWVFYAIGRVCHLLQTTWPSQPTFGTTPIRAGVLKSRGADPSDPLEFYADLHDVPVGGWPDAPHKWAFDPKRVYASAHQRIFKDGKNVWWTYQKDFAIPNNSLFAKLSELTYNRYYSYNTIPGNANSHDPINPEVKPLALTAPVDWQKCAPNTDALYELCRRFSKRPETSFSPKRFPFQTHRSNSKMPRKNVSRK